MLWEFVADFGQFKKTESSCIPFGFLYGLQVYTTCRWPLPIRWFDAHWKRLSQNANELRLECSYPKDVVYEQIDNLLKTEEKSTHIIRLTLVADGVEYGDLFKKSSKEIPSRLVLGCRSTLPPDDAPPLSLMTVAYKRPLPHLKTGAMTESILLRQQAVHKGLDDVLFIGKNPDFSASPILRETSTANIFLAKDGVWWVADPQSSGCLAGITRLQILEIADQIGIDCHFTIAQVLTLDDVRAADAVFITNAAQGLRRIGQIQHEDENILLPWPIRALAEYEKLQHAWLALHQ
jgi:branched-subunit amino acid aminotransferase/4-amino-4-deoxychorismate lyase